MGFFDIDIKQDRNKIIAAGVIGTLAIIALVYAFGGALFSSGKTTSTVSSTPTPTPEASEEDQLATTEVPSRPRVSRLPEEDEVDRQYASLPINFLGSGAFSVPISGRNIFAFWEPGDPVPPPVNTPTPEITTPTPPDYKIFLSFISPQSTFAGSKSFTIQVNGDKFKENSRIIFNGAPIPTRFVSDKLLTARVPETLIARAFTGSVMVDTPGTEEFSRRVAFNVQEPPKPEFEYIGMIARQHYNNDTAYFQEKGARSGEPFKARLNDVVKGRFRVISISAKEVEFEDTRLGFKHKLALLRPPPGSSSGRSRSGYGEGGSDRRRTRSIPGIPRNIRRVNPRRTPSRTPRRVTRPNPNANQKVDDTDRP